MFAQVTSKYDVMTVVEVGHSTREDALKYVCTKGKEIQMMFLFDVVHVGYQGEDRLRCKKFSLPELKKAVETTCSFAEGTDEWATCYFENRGQPRCILRLGDASTK